MAIVTLRLTNSESRTSHWALTPTTPDGPSDWGSRLSDDSDSTWAGVIALTESYVNHLQIHVASLPAIPEGAAIKQVRVRDRKWGAGDSIGATYSYPRIETNMRVGLSGLMFTTTWASNSFEWLDDVGPWRVTTPEGLEWTIDRVNALRLRWRIRSEGNTIAQEGRVGEAWVDVEYNERPVATITGPTGTIIDTSSPTATWDYSDPEGDLQESFRVLVMEGDKTAQAEPNSFIGMDGSFGYEGIYDSGRVYSGNTSHILPSLGNGVYTVWVKVYQSWPSGEHGSAWKNALFTIDIAPPNVPTVTVTPNTSTSSVLVEVSDPGWPSAPVETMDFQIQSSIDGGTTWQNVRGGGVIEAVDGSASLTDYEAPPSKEILYRALGRAYDIGTAEPLISSWSAPVAATLDLDRWWIKCPMDPSMNLKVRRMDLVQSRSRDTRGSVFYPLGRKNAVVVSGLPTSSQFAHRFLTISQEDLDQLMSLLVTGHDFLLAGPRGHWYVRPIGSIEEDYDIRNDPGVYCVVGVNFAEVARP